MLVEFRQNARKFGSKLLMGLLIITFAIWGVGDMLRQSNDNVSVATVGGRSVSLQEYKRDVYRETEKLRQNFGKEFTPEMVKAFDIERQVLQRLIDKNLLALESKEIGFMVSDADVARNIRNNSAFFDEKGQFDKSKFENMLRVTGQTEKNFAQKMREDIAVSLLLNTITSAPAAPEKLAQTLLTARREQRVVDIYTISPTLVNAIPVPNDKQLTEYYNSHAAEFTAPEYRTISYVLLTPEFAKKSIAADKAKISEKDIETAYHEREAEFKKPERRKVDQLLFGSEEAAKKAYDAIASGKTFDQVAKDVKILNSNSISLGVVEKTNIPEVAAEQVFSLKLDAITTPVKSPFGWHVFRVSEILPAATLQLSEVKEKIAKDLEQSSSENAIVSLSNKLDDAIAGGSNLAEAAKDLGITVNKLPAIDKNGKLVTGEIEKTLPKNEKFVEVAFKTDEKTESSLIAGAGGTSYMLRVEAVQPERLLPQEELKNKLVSGWTMQEKKQHLEKLANKIADDFNSNAERVATVNKYNLPTPKTVTVNRKSATSLKLPAKMIAEIFTSLVGKTTTAFMQENGDYSIAVVKSIIPSNFSEKDATVSAELHDINKQYQGLVQKELSEQYLAYLAKKHRVSINLSALNALKEESSK